MEVGLRRSVPIRGAVDRLEIVTSGIDLADRNVLVEGEVVADEVLEYHADRLPERREIVFAEVDPVEQNAPLGRIVEACHQLGERRLARAVLTDQRNPLMRSALQVDVPDRPAIRPRIAKADVLEDEPGLDGSRHRPGAGRGRDVGPDLEKEKEVAEVERLLVDIARLQQQLLNDRPALGERRRQKGERPDRDDAEGRLEHDDGVGPVVAERPDERQRRH